MSQTIVNRLQFESAVPVVILKKSHDSMGREGTSFEKFTDRFYGWEPHVSTPSHSTVNEVTATAGIKYDLSGWIFLAPLNVLIKMIIWKT